MKKYLLSIIISCFFFGTNAQVFELYDENDQLFANGDTVFFNGIETSLPTIHMKVKNVSATEQIVHCRKTYVYVVPGTSNAFCWAGSCYTSMIAPLAATIAAGDINTEFSAEYMPQGITGISIIKYKFYNESGDTAYFVGKYNIQTTGISGNSNEQIFSQPFPIPAKENINLMANNVTGKNAVIEIHDVLGSPIRQTAVYNDGLIQIPVADLKKGIYFVSIKVNNRIIKTHKIIITK